MFSMSKIKNLAVTSVLVLLAIASAIIGQGSSSTLTCISGFIFIALLFGCRTGYQYWRDHAIITQAEQQPVPQQLSPPAMTSKGSSRLFVPEPLDRR